MAIFKPIILLVCSAGCMCVCMWWTFDQLFINTGSPGVVHGRKPGSWCKDVSPRVVHRAVLLREAPWNALWPSYPDMNRKMMKDEKWGSGLEAWLRHRWPLQKYLLDTRKHQNQLPGTRNDERLENHQGPGIFEESPWNSEWKKLWCWAALFQVCRMTWGKGTSNFPNTPSENSLTL